MGGMVHWPRSIDIAVYLVEENKLAVKNIVHTRGTSIAFSIYIDILIWHCVHFSIIVSFLWHCNAKLSCIYHSEDATDMN